MGDTQAAGLARVIDDGREVGKMPGRGWLERGEVQVMDANRSAESRASARQQTAASAALYWIG